MSQFKVVVPQLNKRKIVPSNLPDPNNIVGVVNNGYTFTGEEVPDEDIPNSSLGKWYKGNDGYYYWGGGLIVLDGGEEQGQDNDDDGRSGEDDKDNDGLRPSGPSPVEDTLTADNVEPADADPIYGWEITDYGIDQMWKTTKGKGVKIAVIDTGLNFEHSNIKGKLNIEYFNMFNGSTKASDCLDTVGHGTACAGVIAAQGPLVYGVAPEADLLIIKTSENGAMTCGDLAQAITQAVNLNANIISVSYNFYGNNSDIELLEKAVEFANSRNVLIVAYSGDTGPVLSVSTYPGSYETCLSIGVNDKDKTLWTTTTMNPEIGILAPGANVELIGLDNNKTFFDSGGSYSAPYVAGVIGLLSIISKKSFNDIIANLKQTAVNKTDIRAQAQTSYSSPPSPFPNIGVISL